MKTLRDLKKARLRTNLSSIGRFLGTNHQRQHALSNRDRRYDCFRINLHSYIYEIWYASAKSKYPFLYDRDAKSYF